MAVSVTKVQGPTVPGAEVFNINEVTFDSSYAENGEPLTQAELGHTKVNFAVCTLIAGDEAEESELFQGAVYYTPSTEKIHIINLKTGKELASTKKAAKVKALVLSFGTLK